MKRPTVVVDLSAPRNRQLAASLKADRLLSRAESARLMAGLLGPLKSGVRDANDLGKRAAEHDVLEALWLAREPLARAELAALLGSYTSYLHGSRVAFAYWGPGADIACLVKLAREGYVRRVGRKYTTTRKAIPRLKRWTSPHREAEQAITRAARWYVDATFEEQDNDALRAELPLEQKATDAVGGCLCCVSMRPLPEDRGLALKVEPTIAKGKRTPSDWRRLLLRMLVGLAKARDKMLTARSSSSRRPRAP